MHTHTHIYIFYHCQKSLPYNQFLRVKRICTKQQDFLRHSLNLVGHFKRRGYPDDILKKLLISACSKNRADLLEYNTEPEETLDDDTIFLITTFVPGFEKNENNGQ